MATLQASPKAFERKIIPEVQSDSIFIKGINMDNGPVGYEFDLAIKQQSTVWRSDEEGPKLSNLVYAVLNVFFDGPDTLARSILYRPNSQNAILFIRFKAFNRCYGSKSHIRYMRKILF